MEFDPLGVVSSTKTKPDSRTSPGNSSSSPQIKPPDDPSSTAASTTVASTATASTTTSIAQPEFHLRENLPIYSVFCIDLSPEMDVEMTPMGGVSKLLIRTRIQWLQILLARFARVRNTMNKSHQIGIVTFTTKPTWLLEFTADVAFAERYISGLATTTEDCSHFDLLSVLENIQHQLLKKSKSTERFVAQIIFIYGRSNVMPIIQENRPAMRKVLQHENVFLDVVYLHEKQDKTSVDPNMMQAIYDALLPLENPQKPSYFFELTRSVKKLTAIFAELLASPLQRPLQGDSLFNDILIRPANATNNSKTQTVKN